mgnify:CR=1 FL=1
MNFNTNTPELSDLKKIYDENGYNLSLIHI